MTQLITQQECSSLLTSIMSFNIKLLGSLITPMQAKQNYAG